MNIRMRDKKRIKRILKELERVWNDVPDMRFGQLLINLGIVDDSFRVWNIQDSITEKILKETEWKKN